MTELLCLHLGGDLLKVLKGTVFQTSQKGLLEKIWHMMPPETIAKLDCIRGAY